MHFLEVIVRELVSGLAFLAVLFVYAQMPFLVLRETMFFDELVLPLGRRLM
jgi:hypothetical protein